MEYALIHWRTDEIIRIEKENYRGSCRGENAVGKRTANYPTLALMSVVKMNVLKI
jgi:hypothetical protein